MIAPPALEPYYDYLCRIRVRPMYRGRRIRPEVAALDGRVIILHPGWVMDEEDLYPGEWVMLESLYHEHSDLALVGTSWMPEGDVEILCPIPNRAPHTN